MKLKIKHQRFIDEYLSNGLNGRAAYLAVYPHVKDESADVMASRLLTNVKVAEAIKQAQAITSAKVEITKESLLKDLDNIKLLHQNGDARQATAALKAIDLMIKMLGLNPAIETKVTLNTEQPLFGEIPKKKENLND